MYKAFIRPLLFLLDAEKVHGMVVFMVKFVTAIPGVKFILKKFFFVQHPILETTVAGIQFANRTGLAAGFDKNADFYESFSVFGFSFLEIGTVTPVAQPGNDKPRLFRLKSDRALINRMGFNNKGAAYAAEKLKERSHSMIIGGNIGKNTLTPNESAVNDYEKCFRELYDVVDYFAVNVSCPNIKDLNKLQDQSYLKEILKRLTQVRKEMVMQKPVFLKISPDLTFRQIDEIVDLYYQGNIDGIIATNTTTDRSCLESAGLDAIGPGGLSGAPLKNRALEIIRYICNKSENKLPVIGVGGIITANDAVDMIKAGAKIVQVYTGFIYEGPFIVRKINKELIRYFSNNPVN